MKPIIKSRSKTILVILLAITIMYILVVSSAPLRRLSTLKKQVYNDSIFYARNNSILKNSNLFELAKTKSRKEAELILAQKDTFGLVVDIKDSTIWLMLKGVQIHGAKIKGFEQDRFFKALNPLVFTCLFSKPLRTKQEFSSIVKEPIIIKKAPKDTIEAINNAFMPDTLIQNPAYFRLDLENRFRLILVQKDFLTLDEKKVEKQFKQDILKRKIADNARCFMPWKKAVYTPTLVLYLNANEIRSIYRSIPENALVILTY